MTPLLETYRVQCVLYNSSGEQIAQLPPLTLTNWPSGITLSAPLFQTGSNAEVIGFTGAAQTENWSGTNANGQWVAPGIYLIEAAVTDPYGNVSTLNASVQVFAGTSLLSLEVYSPSGEGVRSLFKGSSVWPPANPELSAKAFLPPSIPHGEGSLKISLGSTGTFEWDGRSDMGAIVAPGIYLVEMDWRYQTATKNIGQYVTVLETTGNDPLAGAWLSPNPAVGGGDVLIGLSPRGALSAAPAEFSGTAYDLSGKAVASLNPAGSGRLIWHTRGSAAGIYLLRLRALCAADGLFRWRVLKAAVLE